jgi:hypothetical protein
MGQFGHSNEKDDTSHNYAHGLSMLDHLGLPTTIFFYVNNSLPTYICLSIYVA